MATTVDLSDDERGAKADAIREEGESLLEELKRNPRLQLAYYSDHGVGYGDATFLIEITREEQDPNYSTGDTDIDRLIVRESEIVRPISVEAFTRLLMDDEIQETFAVLGGFTPERHFRPINTAELS